MPQLNEQQKKKRGQILESMYESFLETHTWMPINDAEYAFAKSIEDDPVKLRMINALAASCTIES